jgi:hypothetical protein
LISPITNDSRLQIDILGTLQNGARVWGELQTFFRDMKARAGSFLQSIDIARQSSQNVLGWLAFTEGREIDQITGHFPLPYR